MAEQNNNTKKQYAQERADTVSVRSQAKLRKDRKTNSRHLMNLFDVFVILIALVIILLLVLGIQLRSPFAAADDGEACTVEYSVVFSDVSADFAEAISSGQAFSIGASTSEQGMVSAVTVEPHMEMTLISVDGVNNAVLQEVPGKIDITVVVRAQAVCREGVGYVIDNRALRVGGVYSFRAPGFVGNGICTDVQVVLMASEEGVQ